jgi:acetolactate synthase-1/2/3 large subunit
MKVFQAVSDALQAEDVKVVFALMGDANQDLMVDLAERHAVKLIKFRHEQNAVAAADGYARFSDGKIGVALVTMGPGLTNTATSLVAARAHRSPVLVLAGAASVGELRNPQRFDQASFSTLMAGAGAVLEAPASLSIQLDQALGHIRRGVGPYVLNLPGNVQKAEACGPYRPGYGAYQPSLPTASRIERAAQLLVEARRPAIVAGRGAVRARAADAIADLANRLQAPIATSLPAKGLCSEHPLWAGVSGGLGDGVALPALEACDLLLVVGASLNQWTTHQNDLVRGKTVIQIDAHAEAFGAFAPVDLMLQGDARETVLALLGALQNRPAKPIEAKTPLCEDLRARWRRQAAPIDYETGSDGSIDPRQVVRELDRLLPRDRLVVAGGGHAGFQVCQLLKIRTPGDWNYTIDFGAIGQAMATAIGAAIARPGRRLYHLTADGEFMMSLADFHTAVAYKLPMTVVVLNDHGFGQERHDLDHKGLPSNYALQPSPDLAAFAEAVGGRGMRFDTPESLGGLEAALRAAEAFEGPTLFDVRINGAYESPVSQEIAKALA